MRCQAELPGIPTSWSLIFSHPHLLPHPHPLPYLNSSWLNSSSMLLSQNTCIERLLQELKEIMCLWQPQRCATYTSLQERACCRSCSELTTSSCCIFSIHCSVPAKANFPGSSQLMRASGERGRRYTGAGPVLPNEDSFNKQLLPWGSPLDWPRCFQNFTPVRGSQPILLPSLPSLPSKM